MKENEFKGAIIIDDPIKPDKATDQEVQQVWDKIFGEEE